MLKNGFITPASILILCIAGLFSCKTAPDITSLSVTIRLPNEPESLHPIFSKSIYAAQIESLILLPLAEYDPYSLTLTPLLLSKMPVGERVTEGKHLNGKVFNLEFRPESEWADGKPVTGEDYLFTFKSLYNPHVNSDSWKTWADFISEIIIDPNDPKKVSVYFDSTYLLDLEATTNFNLYPAHLYDPEKIMSGFTLAELREPNKSWTPTQDSLLRRFAVQYESPLFYRETVTGAGPYELDNWMTGEFIRLKRKQNWWGDRIADAPLLLKAYPTEITYRIILDGAAAEAALKAGEIDLMAEVPVSSFINLKNNPEWADKFQFATPALMQSYYIELNTRDSILADPKIRQALAYSIDYDGILNNIMQGLAKRSVGPIHPEKNYYNKDLVPLSQDINRSLELIKEAGWTDTNGNGTPDKIIGGKRQELQLEIKITNKQEGTTLANIIKENASKAGFDITLIVLDPGQLQQDVREFNFEMTPLRISAYPGKDDPYLLWHSANDRPAGTNRSGFHTPEMDEVIEALRRETDPKIRETHYKKFQEIIFAQQPSIFLYVPLERIIASKKIQLETSARRPGYFENLLKPAGS